MKMTQQDFDTLERYINLYLNCHGKEVGVYLNMYDLSPMRLRWDLYHVVHIQYRNEVKPATWNYKDVHIDTALKAITTITD